MKLIGGSLIVIGVVLGAYAAFLFDPSVASSSVYADVALDRVMNLQRISQQLMMFTASGLVAVAGVCCTAAGEVLDVLLAALNKRKPGPNFEGN